MQILSRILVSLGLWLVLASQGSALEGRFVLDGLGLVLRIDDSRILRGEDLAGLTLVAANSSGEAEIRIDGIAHQGRLAGRPITFYRMSVKDPSGAFRPLCDADPEGERAAFAFPDGAGEFSLTCTSGAEGKCILFGYLPWEAREGVPLRDLHRACIHMLRADYGGDDRSTTRNGTKVNLYDRFGIQSPGHAPGMAFEAAWGPQGAVCVAHPRIADNVTLDELGERHPHLKGRLGPQVCYEEAMRADPRALLFNQSTLTWRSRK
jgi:hypothetical protein